MSAWITAGEARAWHLCPRRAWYDRNLPEGLEPAVQPFDDLVKRLGDQHEADVRARLGTGVEAESEAHTRELMAARAPLIYQAVLRDQAEALQGRPDFLILEPDGYRIGDAKLARSLDSHREIRMQVGVYRRLLGSAYPARVYLQGGTVEEVGEESEELVDGFVAGMRGLAVSASRPPAEFGESKCSACPYDEVCRPDFERERSLGLVYGVEARAAVALRAAGVETLDDLAQSDPDALPDVPYLKGARKRRAVLQARSQRDGHVVSVGELDLPRATCVHLDVESNPLTEHGEAEVYLWGVLPPPYDDDAYEHRWSDSAPGSDRAAWEGFLALVRSYAERWPDLRFAHYSPYERTQIRAYAERYDMTGDPTVAWLLSDDGPLLDLGPVLKAAFTLPLTGYGLKAVCKDERLVGFRWRLAESGAQWSVVRYFDYLESSDPQEREAIREEIVTYNRDDVLASRALEVWMRQVGAQLEKSPRI